MKNKLSPGMRAALKLKIIRRANKDPEFKKHLQKRLDEIAEEQNNRNKNAAS